MSAHNIPLLILDRKLPFIIPNIKCLQLWDFFLGTQERVRNSRGKRAISVRATEVLLYYLLLKSSIRSLCLYFRCSSPATAQCSFSEPSTAAPCFGVEILSKRSPTISISFQIKMIMLAHGFFKCLFLKQKYSTV